MIDTRRNVRHKKGPRSKLKITSLKKKFDGKMKNFHIFWCPIKLCKVLIGMSTINIRFDRKKTVEYQVWSVAAELRLNTYFWNDIWCIFILIVWYWCFDRRPVFSNQNKNYLIFECPTWFWNRWYTDKTTLLRILQIMLVSQLTWNT